MELQAYQAGINNKNHFWFKAKLDFIHVLLSTLQHGKKFTILNVGAGIGDDLNVIKKYGDIYALDIDNQTLDLIPNNLVVEKKCADVCSIPYKDHTFDLVLAFDILEHVPHDQQAVNEIYRVLKPNGTFIFTVPAFNFLFSKHDEMEHHMRRYNKSLVRKLMTKFTQKTLGYWFFSLFIPAALQRMCTKHNSPNKQKDYFQKKLPSFIHSALYKITSIDTWLIKKGLKLPWGLTLYGVYQKSH
jgi:ubiquinone/menaquinone biosynthesis C-methylase UbiE